MNRKIKSICHAFVANDIHTYIPDNSQENHFVITSLLCKKCNTLWDTSLVECYFCGDLNHYLYTCTVCGSMYSITRAKVRCECNDKNSKLIKACKNPACPTNTDSELKIVAEKEGGVFDRKSSFKLSLNYCQSCGNPSNFYKTYRVFIYEYDGKNTEDFIKNNSIEEDDLIIYKKKVDDTILYDYLVIKTLEEAKNYRPKFDKSDLKSIIDKIFSQGQ